MENKEERNKEVDLYINIINKEQEEKKVEYAETNKEIPQIEYSMDFIKYKVICYMGLN